MAPLRIRRLEIAGLAGLRGTLELDPARVTVIAAPNSRVKATLATALAAGLFGRWENGHGRSRDAAEGAMAVDFDVHGRIVRAERDLERILGMRREAFAAMAWLAEEDAAALTPDAVAALRDARGAGPRDPAREGPGDAARRELDDLCAAGAAPPHLWDEADALTERLGELEAARRMEEAAIRDLTGEARQLEELLRPGAPLAALTAEDASRAGALARRLEEIDAERAAAGARLAAAEADTRAAGLAPEWMRRLSRGLARLADPDRDFLARYTESASRLREALERDRVALSFVQPERADETRRVRRERRIVLSGLAAGAAALALSVVLLVTFGRTSPFRPAFSVAVAASLAVAAASAVAAALTARLAIRRDRALAETEDEIKGSMRSRAAGLVRLEARLIEIGRVLGLPEGHDLLQDVVPARDVAERLAPSEAAVEAAATRAEETAEEITALLARAGMSNAAKDGLDVALESLSAAIRNRAETEEAHRNVAARKAAHKARLSEILAEGGRLVPRVEEIARDAGVPDGLAGDLLAEVRMRVQRGRRIAALEEEAARAGRADAALLDELAREASGAVRRLCPEAAGIRIDPDLAVALVPAGAASSAAPGAPAGAAADLVRVAVRATLVRMLGDRGTLPLILDEPLARVDDEGFRAAFRWLAREVAPRMQVIVLTAQVSRMAALLSADPGAAERIDVLDLARTLEDARARSTAL